MTTSKVRKAPDFARRYSRHDGTIGNVSGHDGAGPHDCSRPERYAGHDDGVHADEGAAADSRFGYDFGTALGI